MMMRSVSELVDGVMNALLRGRWDRIRNSCVILEYYSVRFCFENLLVCLVIPRVGGGEVFFVMDDIGHSQASTIGFA